MLQIMGTINESSMLERFSAYFNCKLSIDDSNNTFHLVYQGNSLIAFHDIIDGIMTYEQMHVLHVTALAGSLAR